MKRITNWLRQNIANIVTSSGLVAGFYLMFLTIFQPDQLLKISISYIYGFFTDFIDGPIARHWKIESTIGSFLDRLKDRFLIYPSLFILVWQYNSKFNLLVWGLIATYMTIEIPILLSGIVAFSWYMKGKKKEIKLFEPNKEGKKKTFCAFIVGLTIILSLGVEKYLNFPLIRESIFLIYIGFFLMIYWGAISLFEYLGRHFPQITKEKSSE